MYIPIVLIVKFTNERYNVPLCNKKEIEITADHIYNIQLSRE